MAETDKTIIKHFNIILKNELTAINQYFLHARILRHMGFEKLGQLTYEESIDEMKHSDQIIERILMLGGLPNLQDLGKLMIGETVKEMLTSDMALEVKAIADLKEAITYMEAQQDYASADILHGILTSEEEHQDWLRKNLDLYDSLGEENYLQSQV